MMKKSGSIVLAAAAAAAVGAACVCARRGWTPAAVRDAVRSACRPGNAPRYSPSRAARLSPSPLAGKRIVFLGSSVTYGAASLGVSFADYLAARHGCDAVKEAVSGTTLANLGPDSYVARLRRLDPALFPSLFVCQLSTNDASQGVPLGAPSDSFDPASFDDSTVAGAIETILAWVRGMWGCPVVFYTNPRYDSGEYAAMVRLLHELRGKWGFGVIDLWSDDAFNAIPDASRALWMADPIHPTRAGYLEWWLPAFERALCGPQLDEDARARNE